MKIEITICGRESEININGIANKCKTAYMKQMKMSDFILYYSEKRKRDEGI